MDHFHNDRMVICLVVIVTDMLGPKFSREMIKRSNISRWRLLDENMLETQRFYYRSAISRLIQECKSARELKQVHAQIITSPNLVGSSDRDFLISRLLFAVAISISDSLGYASDIFQRIKNPDLALYNIMIRAHASRIHGHSATHSLPALLLYKQMLGDGVVPDCLTLPFLVKECTRRLDLGTGRGVHGQSIKFGFCNDLFVQNSVVNLYSNTGFVADARKLFDEMPARDVVSWNSMVTGYLRSGNLDEALDLFRNMKKRTVITWNSIITGFVQGGRPKGALGLFREMLCLSKDTDVVKPDKFTIASVLSACGHLGAIDVGNWVHGYLRRSELECDMVIGTALVDMYGKCGCVERASEIFRQMPNRDTLTWTAMISGFALHGFSKEAFDTFEEMEAEGVKPNHITFVGLLSACAHSGSVEKGRWYFDVMKRVYAIEPQVHHYACLVDVLGRAGLFEEAERLIKSMPMEPDVYVWGALLGGCQIHGNAQLGERVAKRLIDLEPQNHAFYMNLCDIYGKACRYDDVKKVRAQMKERGIKKEVQGCSMIVINGVVHEFSATGSSDIAKEELAWMLIALNNGMKIKDSGHYVKDLRVEPGVS